MKRISRPKVNKPNPPTLTRPRFVKMLHSLVSFSLGSGLCSQSSFSTSSGNKRRPAEGKMLYFSDTVCVLTLSSSLPDREGALESAKGSMPYILLSRPLLSELKLVRREGVSVGVPGADSSSRNRWVLDLDGGMSNVSEEPIPSPPYSLFAAGLSRNEGAVGDLDCVISEREEPDPWRWGPNGRWL